MADGWRKIERGLFESADAQWRIANPWKVSTELRHRWLVDRAASSLACRPAALQRVGLVHARGRPRTLHDARAYVEAHPDLTLPASPSVHEH